MRQRAIAGLAVGDTFVVRRTFTQQDTERFGALTRDYNPVHYEPEFARSKGFSGLILHGLLTGSMLCEIGGQIGCLATAMSFVFKRPVYFGDTITCRLTITDLDQQGRRLRASACCDNQHGVRVLEAELRGQLPVGRERELLAGAVNHLAAESGVTPSAEDPPAG